MLASFNKTHLRGAMGRQFLPMWRTYLAEEERRHRIAGRPANVSVKDRAVDRWNREVELQHLPPLRRKNP